MEICMYCGFKYLSVIFEGDGHMFYRCPNKSCNKMDARRKQIEKRGKIIKRDGTVVKVNTYDGKIE